MSRWVLRVLECFATVGRDHGSDRVVPTVECRAFGAVSALPSLVLVVDQTVDLHTVLCGDGGNPLRVGELSGVGVKGRLEDRVADSLQLIEARTDESSVEKVCRDDVDRPLVVSERPCGQVRDIEVFAAIRCLVEDDFLRSSDREDSLNSWESGCRGHRRCWIGGDCRWCRGRTRRGIPGF